MFRMCDGLDEEELKAIREPFLFIFSLQADQEEFWEEMMNNRKMQTCFLDLKCHRIIFCPNNVGMCLECFCHSEC